MITITTRELAKQTGCVEATLNYWRNHEVLIPADENKTGIGSTYMWDESIVPLVKVLVKVEKSFAVVSTSLLKVIAKDFDKGRLELEPGVVLTWET